MANDLSSPALSENGTIDAQDADKIQLKYPEPSTGSQFKEFIKTVIRFSGDLSSLTCPAFFLNGLSLLEYGTYWGDHPQSFTAIPAATEPQERMLEVARWFMSTLWGSYASRCTNGLNEKKPYNPVLGEQFFCKLGDVDCICEQVSHHPPISAFYLEDEKTGISLNGHCGQKSKFKGTTIRVDQVGRATLYLKKWDEQYVLDFPVLNIKGFLTAASYIDLSGTCTIACTNGATTVMEFLPKPWFGGESNCIKGSVSYGGKEYYTLSGRWSHKSYYSISGDSAKHLLFDADAEPMAERVTAPLEQQHQYETHRLWGPVTEALKVKNYTVANAEKSKIEELQRQLKKQREATNEVWKPTLFQFLEDSDKGDQYVARNTQLKDLMIGHHDLDNGAWTYSKSLHQRGN
ncbi:hypothetical protein K450DRAFT_228235 [Umbelopsis ramanniana AG]|uniref:Oxysterol-binding protein n=1 Tax=Umbelopsis ramanniana AG TaxID=1314678 RepID=A0AAD5HFC8_UMBRA|nr:uncharacterized protein K450DRAFT_228235 [Umbelopsis ramanniana AG]KAI8582285.1 hypothetical protein K450DRAFT_228235 [Umbelopsis ramanniana AG]